MVVTDLKCEAPATGRCKACVLLALNLFPLLKLGKGVVINLEKDN
jgi:hypothetical protein